MKTSVDIPNWKELNEIFEKNDFRLNEKVLDKIRALGYKVVKNKGKHPKMYIKHNNKTYVITMSSTPSKQYNGRVILREIRKIYETR